MRGARADYSGERDPLGLRRVALTRAALRIAAEIERSGPVSFRRFMEMALYDPEVGYYARAAAGPGPAGDYVTSPELHAAFGALVCAQLAEMWRSLGEPDPFWLVESGPGTGAFAADVLSVAAEAFPGFARALRVALVERVPALRARQRAALAGWGEKVMWLDSRIASPSGRGRFALSPAKGEPGEGQRLTVPVGPGCVFANELLDAFPVHRVVMREEGLRECFVTVRDSRFVEVEEAPSTPLLVQQIEAGGGALAIGCYGEVNTDAPSWILAAARLIDRGYVLLIDYGDWADRLYGPAYPRGTLRCYRQHVLLGDPLGVPGERDITAHVDFSAVTRSAARAGLEWLGSASQAALLRRLGLDQLREAVKQRVAGRIERRAHKAALELLADAGGLGNLTALLFGKGVPAMGLAGFTPGRALPPPGTPAVWRVRGDPLRLLTQG